MIRYSYKFMVDVAWGLNTLEECLRYLSLLVLLSHCYSMEELDRMRIICEKRMLTIKKQQR